jgi:uncharacterized protein (DUF1684 family)
VRPRRLRGVRVLLVLGVAVAAAAGPHAAAQRKPKPPAPTWQEELQAWRAKYDAELRADDGWLSVAGLYFLKPGPNVFGTAGSSDIVLPRDAAPERAGVVTLKEGRVFFEVAERVEATLNGEPVTSGELAAAAAEPLRPADVLRVGRISMLVHRSGPRLGIRIRDPEGPVRTTFTGTRWFPPDARWRVTGEFVPHASPRPVAIVNILGDELTLNSPGVVRFTVAGRSHSLMALADRDRLWFIFTDATAGKDTYKAARFLYASLPRDGRVLVDFNRAENPPCAYNPFTTCPLPPKENRLEIAVTAGEKDYPNRWQPR